MSHNSFSMGTLPMVLPKNIFSTRSDGTNFRDGIIKRRRPNLKEIDMVYNLCRILKKYNPSLFKRQDIEATLMHWNCLFCSAATDLICTYVCLLQAEMRYLKYI